MSHKPHGKMDGNPVLYTSTMFVIAHYLDQVTPQLIDHCQKMYLLVQREPGLITRGPHKPKDRQAHDDPVGCSAGLYVLRLPEAKDFWKYGMEHGWLYWTAKQLTLKNVGRQLFFRLPGVIQHFTVCGDEELSKFDRFFTSVDFYSTAFKPRGATSGRIMDWDKIQAYKLYKKVNGGYTEIDDAIVVWEDSLKRKYPNGFMGEVFGLFFGDNQHAFAVAMHGKI